MPAPTVPWRGTTVVAVSLTLLALAGCLEGPAPDAAGTSDLPCQPSELDEAAHALDVRVTWNDTGEPVANACVTVSGEGRDPIYFYAVTDGDGIATLHLAQGTWDGHVSKPLSGDSLCAHFTQFPPVDVPEVRHVDVTLDADRPKSCA